jgi:hypothetical protein
MGNARWSTARCQPSKHDLDSFQFPPQLLPFLRYPEHLARNAGVERNGGIAVRGRVPVGGVGAVDRYPAVASRRRRAIHPQWRSPRCSWVELGCESQL